MERNPDSAVALEWEFRCRGTAMPGHPWEWRCRTRDGTAVATSKGAFASLNEAIADARANGFTFHHSAYAPPGTPAAVASSSFKFDGDIK